MAEWSGSPAVIWDGWSSTPKSVDWISALTWLTCEDLLHQYLPNTETDKYVTAWHAFRTMYAMDAVITSRCISLLLRHSLTFVSQQRTRHFSWRMAKRSRTNRCPPMLTFLFCFENGIVLQNNSSVDTLLRHRTHTSTHARYYANEWDKNFVPSKSAICSACEYHSCLPCVYIFVIRIKYLAKRRNISSMIEWNPRMNNFAALRCSRSNWLTRQKARLSCHTAHSAPVVNVRPSINTNR